MGRYRHALASLISAVCAVSAACPSRADEPAWPVPRFSETPITSDGGHAIEGTSTADAWAWRARLGSRYAYGAGLADRASQVRADLVFGLGLPVGLETAVRVPGCWTIGAEDDPRLDARPSRLEGMSEDGVAMGDLGIALLWSWADPDHGGLGLLVGLLGTVPTGDNDRLAGEGGFTIEPMASFALQVLGARVSINLSYRVREERDAHVGGERFEQDDDLVWRAALRIPKEHDVAWSIEAEGTVGLATYEGGRPGSDSRPVWLGGGVDFPVSRARRLGLFAGFGLDGVMSPVFSAGLWFAWMPVLPDEDGDGVGGASDECPLLAEDRDGFEDGDGCPDLDNDEDGFPDDEDACPDEPAGDLSDDGCAR